MKKNKGLTKVEVMAIIAMILVIMFTITSIIGSTIYDGCNNDVTKVLIGDFDKALEKYNMDRGSYPPDNENNGGNQEGIRFQYRNDILVKYLDGDISNGGPRAQYFEFVRQDIDEKNPLITVSCCNDAIWYHNFNDDIPKLENQIIDKNAVLHPWTNAIFYKRFQLYTKNKKKPYDGEEKNAENFQWTINYK